MNKIAIIQNQKYIFLDTVKSLDDSTTCILCENVNGEKYMCSEELWDNSAQHTFENVPINTHSSASEKIEFFMSMFKGRKDIYARRYYSTKTGKSGYTPVCKNEWKYGLCDKNKCKCSECPNRESLPMTAEVVKAHLMGRDTLGRDVAAIYPMLEDNTTWLLAVDFDEESWQQDVLAFSETCRDAGITPAIERSRSGNGAHVWLFFTEPVQASEARRLGSGLLTRTMANRHELSFSSYDRLFPAQDFVPKGGFGNLIALPFQGQAQKSGNTLFVDSQFVPYADQWAFLSGIQKITPEQLEKNIKALCNNGDIGELATSEESPQPWEHKRKPKELMAADFPVNTRLIISNLIYIEKQGLSQAALNKIKRLAAFSNPEFRTKQAMRLPVYNIPRILDCGYEDNKYIGIPRGCQEQLIQLLETYGVQALIEDERCKGKPIDVSFDGELREEQKTAVQALLNSDMGVLSATTAFGKTVIAAYLIGKRRTNTLILVQSSALMEQWKSSLAKFLKINEALPEVPKKRGRAKKRELIGQIGAGKNTRSGIIDIAIMQSLFEGKEKTVKSFVAEYGMVIADECHHVAAFTFESVLKTVEAKYVYGLSATPVRKDGHQPIIFMQCGPIRYLVDAKSQAEKRPFEHFVIPKFTRTRLPNANNIQDMYAGVIESDNRNALLVSDTLKLVQEGRTPILLTERKEHAIRLSELLAGKVQNLFLLIGSDSQKDKRRKLEELQLVPDEESLVVVATGKYIGEGFDSPRLDTLLLAMPISWKGTLAQYAGRLHRNYAGKHEVRIYDYVDIHIPTLERMYHKRLKGYAELGYQVKFSEQDEAISKIYDGYKAIAAFDESITNATKSILIVSSYVQTGRVNRLVPTLKECSGAGITVTIHIKSTEDSDDVYKQNTEEAIKSLKHIGAAVIEHKELQQRYAVIDESQVWYGSIDFLAYGRKDANALCFENADIAGELIELVN